MRLIHVTTYNHTFSVLFSILLYKYNYPFHIDKLYIISALLCYHTNYYCQSVSQFSHSVVSDSLRPHESQHTRPPCPSPTPGVHLDARPSSQCRHSLIDRCTSFVMHVCICMCIYTYICSVCICLYVFGGMYVYISFGSLFRSGIARS